MTIRSRFAGRNALIPGGSQGIGFATARRFLLEGGSVTIVARREGPLQAAQEQLAGLVQEGQFLETISADASDETSIGPVIDGLVERRGTPNYLLNCVGGSYPAYVTDLNPVDLRSQMETNYLGQAIPALLMVPHFHGAGGGHLGFVSSMMGYFVIIGFAAYAPAKFAVVGFAEALRHELKPQGVAVSILYPPDTDTPGFENENRTKPAETAIMSEGAGLLTADQVAETFLKGVAAGRLHIHPKGSGLPWRLQRYVPGVLRTYLDYDLRRATRKARM
ncbi:MAG TPA: SDR family NAD(P)-dependent oxidoreductase [Actinobacteria bacterium]|nr:SDR family NAD(P)-dependent oxidoreductase [Actinomycetota bacterium]